MPDAPESVETPKEVPPEPQAKVEPKIEDPATGRRRRGRRQVIKKKTVKDEDGYLGEFQYFINMKDVSADIGL
jgi:DNA polymerase delta subunit 3